MMNKTLIVACFAVIMPLAYGDQGGFLNSGGSLGGGSPVANPPGTLIISGNILTFAATDNSAVVNATFTTSSTVENCSGGGKGGHTTCSFTFTGTFAGTLTANGYTQAINGSTYQVYGTNGVVAAGNTGYNSAYTPFYFTDGNARILRSDDLSGTNAIAYGTQGRAWLKFDGPQGIVLNSSGWKIHTAGHLKMTALFALTIRQRDQLDESRDLTALARARVPVAAEHQHLSNRAHRAGGRHRLPHSHGRHERNRLDQTPDRPRRFGASCSSPHCRARPPAETPREGSTSLIRENGLISRSDDIWVHQLDDIAGSRRNHRRRR